MRDKINSAMKQAMRDKEALRLSTLRLVMAAIKDRDIAARVDLSLIHISEPTRPY